MKKYISLIVLFLITLVLILSLIIKASKDEKVIEKVPEDEINVIIPDELATGSFDTETEEVKSEPSNRRGYLKGDRR